jgi:hypothetical protein
VVWVGKVRLTREREGGERSHLCNVIIDRLLADGEESRQGKSGAKQVRSKYFLKLLI